MVLYKLRRRNIYKAHPQPTGYFNWCLLGKGKWVFSQAVSRGRHISHTPRQAPCTERSSWPTQNRFQVFSWAFFFLFCFGIFVFCLFFFWEKNICLFLLLFFKQGLCVQFWIPGACSVDQVGKFIILKYHKIILVWD